MCGITGFISNTGDVKEKDYKNFLSLLVLNQERGTDSAGIAMMGDCIRIRKAPVEAYRLLKRLKYMPNQKALIGHTRFATTGIVNKQNAHPFRYGRITGIHNGIVSNYTDFKKDFKVDSEAIFYLLNKCNNDFISAFEKLEGQFAVAWFDEIDKNTLYLAKDGNPLFIARTDDGYYFSSLKLPLESVLLRDIREWVDTKDEEAYKISNGKLERFKIEFKDSYYGTSSKTGFSRLDWEDYGYNYGKQKHLEVMQDDLYEAGYVPTEKGKCAYCEGKEDLYKDLNSGEVICEYCLGIYNNY